MIEFVQGNLLDSDVEALVNTVNTVGVMGKGIALMFKEAFPENYRLYADACNRGDVKVGRMFVTENKDLFGPQWIINFPTKQHWRRPSKLEWIREGLHDLVRVVREKNIHSIALPPLGCGNGGLHWPEVKELILTILEPLAETRIIVYEPVEEYMGRPKSKGVEELTPALELTTRIIDGFQSAFGMELLATIDWLLVSEHIEASPEGIKKALANWPGGRNAAERKLRIFSGRHIELGLERILGTLQPVAVS